jgi:hypothetical protein
MPPKAILLTIKPVLPNLIFFIYVSWIIIDAVLKPTKFLNKPNSTIIIQEKTKEDKEAFLKIFNYGRLRSFTKKAKIKPVLKLPF